MNSMNCITLSESFWRTLEEFQTSMWRTLVRVQSDLQDNGFFSALCPVYVRLSLSWVYITEALYKSIHVSLCRRHNGTLYIYWTREFLQYNLFNSRTCEGVQRRRGIVGLNKEHSDRDHIHGDTHKKQLFALWWWCFVANVFDQNEIESFHTESGLCSQSNYRCFSHTSAGVEVSTVLSVGALLWSSQKNGNAYSMDWFNDFVQTFMVSREWISMTWNPLTPPLLDGLPWNFGDPLTSHVPPSTSVNINLSNTKNVSMLPHLSKMMHIVNISW